MSSICQDAAWPEYRGPSADGWAEFADPPVAWSETENVRWKTPIPGRGWSTPAVAGGQAWLTTATEDGQRLSVLGVDVETGEILHDRLVFEVKQPEKRNQLNSYASPSPTIEAGRVYVHFGTYGTACLDTQSAEIIWSRSDIHCDHMEGPGSSPILFEDLLIFHMDGGDVQFVIALDKQTGEIRWKTKRSLELGGLIPDLRKAYSTPVLIERDGRQQLISQGAQAVYSYDPRTGEELWRLPVSGFSMATRPLVEGNLLYVSSGFTKAQLLALRLDAKEPDNDSQVEWSYTGSVPTMSSGLLVDGRIYLVNDSGMACCLDAQTGERIWRQRLGGAHCASPVHAADRIYYFDRQGLTTVIAPGPEFEPLAENQLDDGFMASPVIIQDAFILRTEKYLYRIEEL